MIFVFISYQRFLLIIILYMVSRSTEEKIFFIEAPENDKIYSNFLQEEIKCKDSKELEKNLGDLRNSGNTSTVEKQKKTKKTKKIKYSEENPDYSG